MDHLFNYSTNSSKEGLKNTFYWLHVLLKFGKRDKLGQKEVYMKVIVRISVKVIF